MCNLMEPLMTIAIKGVEYWTEREVVEEMGVSRQTLWRWRKQGSVPPGRRYRDRNLLFTAEEVAAISGFAHRIEPAQI